jgi:hypothetical protein
MQQASSRAPGRATIAPRRPEDRTPAQIAADQRWLARFRYCAGCDQSPCACTDEATDLILEADALGLYSGGFDDSPEAWGA